MALFGYHSHKIRLGVLAGALFAFAAPVNAGNAGHDNAGHDHGAHDHSVAPTHGHDQKTGHATHGMSSDQNMQMAKDGHAGHDMSNSGDHAATDHRMPNHLGMDMSNGAEIAMRADGYQYKRSIYQYDIPAVTLRNQNAQKVNVAELLAYDGPILLNFIFTSCATICPVMSATFGHTQKDLVAIDDGYLMVSISIDPDYDTPRRLREYAELHEARDNWVMLTGQFDDIFTVVRAFDAVYKGENKMYHRPLTFLRSGADAPWLRLEGLLSSEELAEEYASLIRPEVN